MICDVIGKDENRVEMSCKRVRCMNIITHKKMST